jgi:hypothetical protein
MQAKSASQTKPMQVNRLPMEPWDAACSSLRNIMQGRNGYTTMHRPAIPADTSQTLLRDQAQCLLGDVDLAAHS